MRRAGAIVLAVVLVARSGWADSSGNWPGFHGGGALIGVADGGLPDSLKTIWKVRLGGAVKSSAAVGNGLVYVGSDDGALYALDAATGAVRWKFSTGGPVEASPLIAGDAVYFGSSDDAMYALDARTGALRWKQATGDRILGGANVAVLPDGRTRIVVGSYDRQLRAFDPKTGAVAWSFSTENYVHAAPAVHGARVVFGGCDGRLRMIDAADGTVLLDYKVGAYMAGSIALAEGSSRAFLGHYGNAALGLDLDDEKVLWTYRDRAFPFFSSPALAADRIVIGSRDRRVHAIARATGKPLWTFQTQGRVDGSPVIAGDKVVIGSADGRLYLLRLSDGKKRWSQDLGAAIAASPAVAGGRVYIGAEDGRVYAFGPNASVGARP